MTYAPEFTNSFVVVWDQNGGTGLGRTEEIEPVAGGSVRAVTVTLDRARLAGQGTRGIDIAVGGREGVCLCDVEVSRSGTTDAPTAFGRVRLEVTDAESGRSIPARVGLYDSTGRMPLPSDEAILVHRFTDEVRRLWVNPRAPWAVRESPSILCEWELRGSGTGRDLRARCHSGHRVSRVSRND